MLRLLVELDVPAWVIFELTGVRLDMDCQCLSNTRNTERQLNVSHAMTYVTVVSLFTKSSTGALY